MRLSKLPRQRGAGEPENHDGVVIPTEIQAGGRQALLHGSTQRFQRVGFQAVEEHVGSHADVARRGRDHAAQCQPERQ